ncbi:MAG: MerR family transcriptional regulator [Thermoanaerobaculia bacterium]
MPETAEKTYKAAEVCKSADVAPYVLKYWLTEFSCLSASDKDKSLNRNYSAKEVQIVSRIRQLLYDEGFTIAGAKKKIDAEISAGEFDGKPGAKKKAAAAPAPVKPIPLPAPAGSEAKPVPVETPAPRAAVSAQASLPSAVSKPGPALDAKRLAKELREILKMIPK